MRLANTNAKMRQALLEYEPIGDDVAKIIAASKSKCAVCKCHLDNVFTGIHVITDGVKQKIVCGLCAAKLEVAGWKEVLRAKTVGRD